MMVVELTPGVSAKTRCTPDTVLVPIRRTPAWANDRSTRNTAVGVPRQHSAVAYFLFGTAR